MKKFHQFDLKQMSELLRGEAGGQMLDDYLSENLVVAYNPPVRRLLSRLSEDTYVLPEMRVMVLLSGTAHPTVNLIPRTFEAGQVVFLSHNSIVRLGDYSDDIRGFGISLTDELVSLIFSTSLPPMLDGHVRDFNFMLTAQERHRLESLHALLREMMQGDGRDVQVILHLVAAFLWQVHSYWSRYENDSRASLPRDRRLFADFMQLVSQYATQEHGIDFYAGRLFLSPRYMSTLVKRVSGKAAKQWIDEAIVTRIKVELRHSDKSVAQIADSMNFPNPSFFCKYFKRMTGMTTQAYRNRG